MRFMHLRELSPVELAALLAIFSSGYSDGFFGAYSRAFLLGTPLVWQSKHLTACTLWGLLTDLNVVSMVSTLMPQLESCGWQVEHDARVVWPCFS
jgi:hypothetical protein